VRKKKEKPLYLLPLPEFKACAKKRAPPRNANGAVLRAMGKLNYSIISLPLATGLLL
jgi:hypothetical protein